MRVVLFLDSPLIATGYASTCRLTAKELAKRGHEVFGITFNGGPQPDHIVDWYGIKVFPNKALKRDPNAMYGDATLVAEVMSELNPDILFFHNDSYRYSYLDKLPKDFLDRSVFWLPFEGEQPDYPGIKLFEKMAATRFVTRHATELHRPHMQGKDIGAIPHAVDLENYSIAKDKRAAKLAKNLNIQDKFVAVRVDRHQPRKYWDLTLQAFAKFAKGKEDVFLLGKCHPRDLVMYNESTKEGMDLDRMAEELGIKSKVFFDDFFFSVQAMASCFYHPADVFLTTTSGEGFGLTPVEAMACGLPIICPDTPVLPEVLGDGALFCKIKKQEWYKPMNVMHNIVDVDDVTAKLEWAYADYKKGGKALAEMGERGRKTVEKLYNPQVVYDKWNEVFHAVAEKRDLASIVTVLYNVSGEPQLTGEDGIQKFKETIEKYVTNPYEWIIVDNASPAKGTREWLEKAAESNPKIKPVFLDTNMGFGGACNAGIAKAQGNWIFLANPDSEALDPYKLRLPADFLRMMIDKAKTDPYIGIVGMEVNRRDDVLTGSMFPYFCNVLITRTCLDACRMGENKWFDERFWPAYYEDCDFVIRALGKGFKAVEHNVPFWHKSGGTNKHMIEGGVESPHLKHISAAMDVLEKSNPSMADFPRKRGELTASGMQGLIAGNIHFLNKKWGAEARSKIKIVWNTHIGAGVGFSQIAEGLVPELHKLGFDVYINDWSNGANVEDPLIRQLIEKTRRANQEGDELDGAIHIVCWLMETFMNVDADYKVGISFCESTKVRPQYLKACNSMDRILTFSDFCRGVQKDSGYTSPINVVPPGVHPIFMNYYDRPVRDKFSFLSVGVSQDRKDTYRLVKAFTEMFPKDAKEVPECEPGFPYKCSQMELVLKSNNFGALDWVHKEGFSKIANIRTIFTGWDERAERKDFTMQEMYDLYTSCDCLVHPSHGEGIGMPILEAAATGMPVIFTNWSSPSEYITDQTGYPCSLSPYPGTTFTDAYVGAGPAGENGKWANIHIGHMKHLMREVVRERAKAKQKGKAAAEMIKKHYNWAETARHLMPLIFDWEDERRSKDNKSHFDPLTFERPKLEPVKKGDRVLVDVVTRDRHSYLCSLVTSLLGQTFKEWDIVVQCDDADESMPTDYQIMSLMGRCSHEGHGWRIIRSHRQGPHIAHDRSLQMALDDPNYKYKLICRVDDDIILRPDFLERLFEVYLDDPNADIAAVSGVYLDPKRADAEQMAPPGFDSDINYAGKIDHNVMWPYVCPYPPGTKPRLVEHLYSSFMYRVEAAKAIGGYCRKFSQIGHREESDFTYRFFLGGWKQYIQPKAIGFHFYAPAGGIRADNIGPNKAELARGDEEIYNRRLKKWKKRFEQRKQLDAQKAKEQTVLGVASTPPPPTVVIGYSEPEPVPEPAKKAEAPVPQFKRKKIATIINGAKRLDTIMSSIDRFAPISDEIYITCEIEAFKKLLSGMDKVQMVATTNDEVALLTKAILADGDHEFVLTVTDKTIFMGDPTSLISDDYDDYVFESYRSYVPGRVMRDPAGQTSFVASKEEDGYLVGPEVRNVCMLTRRRQNAVPKMDRIFYAEMIAIEDDRIPPVNGQSLSRHDLIKVSEMSSKPWTKICTFQYPEGKLKTPRSAEVLPQKEKMVSIIIPTAGRLDLLKQCINSIYSNTSTPFEIIIVDNGSSDGTMEYLLAEMKIRKNLRHIRQQINMGYQKAINIGVGAAKGEHILLFNDDAWVVSREDDGRDWLEVYVDELKDQNVGLVGPHGGKSPALGNDILYFWCVMFRRSMWDQIGPLDDVTFRNYGGDDDYCLRVRAAGFEIRQKVTKLRHLMTCVPESVKRPELEESVVKLRAKWLDKMRDGILVPGSPTALVAG